MDVHNPTGNRQIVPNFDATELYEAAGLDPNDDPRFAELTAKNTSPKDFTKHIVEMVRLRSKPASPGSGAPMDSGPPPVPPQPPVDKNTALWQQYKQELAVARGEQVFQLRDKYRALGLFNPETGNPL